MGRDDDALGRLLDRHASLRAGDVCRALEALGWQRTARSPRHAVYSAAGRTTLIVPLDAEQWVKPSFADVLREHLGLD